MTVTTVRWLVFPALIAVSVLDAATTLVALNTGGSEVNPLAAALVPMPPLFIAVKLVLPVGAWLLWERSRRAVWWPVGPLMIVSVAVLWNMGVLLYA